MKNDKELALTTEDAKLTREQKLEYFKKNLEALEIPEDAPDKNFTQKMKTYLLKLLNAQIEKNDENSFFQYEGFGVDENFERTLSQLQGQWNFLPDEFIALLEKIFQELQKKFDLTAKDIDKQQLLEILSHHAQIMIENIYYMIFDDAGNFYSGMQAIVSLDSLYNKSQNEKRDLILYKIQWFNTILLSFLYNGPLQFFSEIHPGFHFYFFAAQLVEQVFGHPENTMSMMDKKIEFNFIKLKDLFLQQLTEKNSLQEIHYLPRTQTARSNSNINCWVTSGTDSAKGELLLSNLRSVNDIREPAIKLKIDKRTEIESILIKLFALQKTQNEVFFKPIADCLIRFGQFFSNPKKIKVMDISTRKSRFNSYLASIARLIENPSEEEIKSFMESDFTAPRPVFAKLNDVLQSFTELIKKNYIDEENPFFRKAKPGRSKSLPEIATPERASDSVYSTPCASPFITASSTPVVVSVNSEKQTPEFNTPNIQSPTSANKNNLISNDSLKKSQSLNEINFTYRRPLLFGTPSSKQSFSPANLFMGRPATPKNLLDLPKSPSSQVFYTDNSPATEKPHVARKLSFSSKNNP